MSAGSAARLSGPVRRLRSRAASTGGAENRVLVGLAANPSAAALVRTAHELAGGAVWIAVHVETADWHSPAAQRLLDENLTRARDLGAEIVVTRDHDVAAGLLRVARDQGVTHLLVGQTQPRRFGWMRATPGERLVAHGAGFAVLVLPAVFSPLGRPAWKFRADRTGHSAEYGLVLCVVSAVTAAGLALPLSSRVSIGLVYLLAVIVLSLRVGRWPVLFAGMLSALAWQYVFIPPQFSFALATPEDALLVGTYFVVALVAGQLTARIRAQARNERQREERATALLHLTRVMTDASSFDEAVTGALRQAEDLFGAPALLALARSPNERLAPHPASGFDLDSAEMTAAETARRQDRHATPVTAKAAGFYVPLQLDHGTVGVFGVKMPSDRTLNLPQRDLIEAFARQLALLVERDQLRIASEREQLLAKSEKLHRALLDSVSHELRTPLAVIGTASEELCDAAPPLRAELIDEIRLAARRLNRLVSNLLDQTRLESGALKPRVDWCDTRDLVNAAVEGTRDALAGRQLEIDIPDDLPSIRADFALTEHALANLLVNAALYTPEESPIAISVGIERESIRFAIADRGPGFPPTMRGRLFKKFARGDAGRTGGVGLGLSIVQGLITAQGGEVTVADRKGGGAVVTVSLPLGNSKHLPPA